MYGEARYIEAVVAREAPHEGALSNRTKSTAGAVLTRGWSGR
jgi:hypothetical protein